MKNLFLTIPHSGRRVPPEAFWLKKTPPEILYCDTDAFADQLYEPAVKQLNLRALIFPWVRCAVDANRLPTDISLKTVQGGPDPSTLQAPTEIHWPETTQKDRLITKPLPQKLHKLLIKKYYDPFHQQIRKEFEARGKPVFHLDLHSMPSVGRDLHQDAGRQRAQVVIGNRDGASASAEFTNSALTAYKKAGFEAVLNRPYKGGRITECYGRPKEGRHTLQIELNRSLYMNERTGRKSPNFSAVQQQLVKALTLIVKYKQKA